MKSFISKEPIKSLVPKKFKFRLATVLRYRQILKDLQEAKLMQINNAVNQTEDDIRQIDSKRTEAYQSLADNLTGAKGFSIIDQNNTEAYNYMLLHDKAKEQSRLAKRKRAQQFEQVRYVSYATDLKAIEKLEDKAKELHQKELLEEEMKQIDDLVNSRQRVEEE